LNTLLPVPFGGLSLKSPDSNKDRGLTIMIREKTIYCIAYFMP
jgi:hypothetical protein